MKVSPRFKFVTFLVPLALSLSACGPQGPTVHAEAPGATAPAAPDYTATAPFQGDMPGDLPADRADQASDVDASSTAAKKLVVSGDRFVHGLFERPFNSDPMDKYFPYLDIVQVQAFKDATWGYATITMQGTDASGGLPGQYAVEIDVDRNGRGEFLIRATDVASTDWTTKGVQAFKDADGDVGGKLAMTADSDSQAPGGTGYEDLIFDEGKGQLTDGAWARIKPDDPKTVEIAFKLSMIGDPSLYAMGAWAGTKIDPAQFDYNDHMTHAQAGSPLQDLVVYPLKALSEIDNTCRIAIGFVPTGQEPGLCKTVEQERQRDEPAGPGAPPPPPPPVPGTIG